MGWNTTTTINLATVSISMCACECATDSANVFTLQQNDQTNCKMSEQESLQLEGNENQPGNRGFGGLEEA